MIDYEAEARQALQDGHDLILAMQLKNDVVLWYALKAITFALLKIAQELARMNAANRERRPHL